MPKSSKRFILSNEKVNSHGFRVITSGIDISIFLKNPIMYWMHDYPEEGDDKQSLPIGFWDDIQIIDNALTAIPVFDDSDDFAMKIYNKVEHGTIRATSIAINPVELDANKANWLPGQTLPTFLRSVLSESSIVDRGSNSDAVALNLGRNTVYLKLKTNNAITEPHTMKSNEVTTPSTEDQKTYGHNPTTLAIVKNAVACGKLTQLQADDMLSTSINEPSVVKANKDIIKKLPINPQNIEGKYHHTLITEAATKSYDEIHKTDCQLRSMKANAPELYKAKFLEKFDRLPGDVA